MTPNSIIIIKFLNETIPLDLLMITPIWSEGNPCELLCHSKKISQVLLNLLSSSTVSTHVSYGTTFVGQSDVVVVAMVTFFLTHWFVDDNSNLIWRITLLRCSPYQVFMCMLASFLLRPLDSLLILMQIRLLGHILSTHDHLRPLFKKSKIWTE